MAHYHFSKFSYGRQQTLKSSAVYARYILRESEEQKDATDLRQAAVGNIPTWAQGDIIHFFEETDRLELPAARTADSWEMGLPRELSHEQQVALVRDFIQIHRGEHKAFVWAIHEPLDTKSLPQPHVHVIMSTRLQDGIERSPEQFFKQWRGADPEHSGCQKDMNNGHKSGYKVQRQAWADLVNWHLEDAGYTRAVDPRSLDDRDINRRPEKRRDKDLGTKRAIQQETQTQEEAQALAYWHHRKHVLGLTPDLSHAEAVARISHSMHHGDGPRLTLEQLREQRLALEAHLAQLEHHSHRLHALGMQQQHLERTGQAASPAHVRRSREVERESIVLGMGGFVDDAPTQGAHFKFKDRSKGADRGYDW